MKVFQMENYSVQLKKKGPKSGQILGQKSIMADVTVTQTIKNLPRMCIDQLPFYQIVIDRVKKCFFWNFKRSYIRVPLKYTYIFHYSCLKQLWDGVGYSNE